MTNNPHKTIRPIVRKMADAARKGRMDRREFMALASVLGVGSATASGLLGLTVRPAFGARAENGRYSEDRPAGAAD